MISLKDIKIGFIGGGNMAFAIGNGLLNRKILQSDKITVSGPNLNNLKRWKDAGISNLTTNNYEVIKKSDIIFLCIKPNVLKACALAIMNDSDLVKNEYRIHSEKIMVSVLAGTSLETLIREFNFLGINIVRSMPNTPMQIGAGCTLYADNISTDGADLLVLNLYEKVKFIFDQLGISYKVDEVKIDPFTALSGCTPAFVYQIIEALSDGGVKQGIPREMAIRMAAQTVMGASKMVLDTGKHPAVLKDEVCSPHGATICGIHELEKGSLRATLINAIDRATDRIKEMKME